MLEGIGVPYEFKTVPLPPHALARGYLGVAPLSIVPTMLRARPGYRAALAAEKAAARAQGVPEIASPDIRP